MTTPEKKAAPEKVALFEAIAMRFQKTSLGPSRWPLVVLATIVGAGEPDAAADLYLHLTSSPDCSTPQARQALVRRLREVLVKSVSIYGVCKPIVAILAINAVEQPQDKDSTFTREHWSSGPENHQRGLDWLAKVYSKNVDDQLQLFKDHQDFGWISENITYGLYLSDRQVLDDIETELVVLSGIMIQNLPKVTWWHIRGARRVGISKDDVKVVWECINMIAEHVGISLHKVPRPEEVESDV